MLRTPDHEVLLMTSLAILTQDASVTDRQTDVRRRPVFAQSTSSGLNNTMMYMCVCLIYLFIYLLHGLYRTLSHSQSEESQVRGGHKSVSENLAVKFSF